MSETIPKDTIERAMFGDSQEQLATTIASIRMILETHGLAQINEPQLLAQGVQADPIDETTPGITITTGKFIDSGSGATLWTRLTIPKDSEPIFETDYSKDVSGKPKWTGTDKFEESKVSEAQKAYFKGLAAQEILATLNHIYPTPKRASRLKEMTKKLLASL